MVDCVFIGRGCCWERVWLSRGEWLKYPDIVQLSLSQFRATLPRSPSKRFFVTYEKISQELV